MKSLPPGSATPNQTWPARRARHVPQMTTIGVNLDKSQHPAELTTHPSSLISIRASRYSITEALGRRVGAKHRIETFPAHGFTWNVAGGSRYALRATRSPSPWSSSRCEAPYRDVPARCFTWNRWVDKISIRDCVATRSPKPGRRVGAKHRIVTRL